jgi:hypothetical protein
MNLKSLHFFFAAVPPGKRPYPKKILLRRREYMKDSDGVDDKLLTF